MEKTYEGFLNALKKKKPQENLDDPGESQMNYDEMFSEGGKEVYDKQVTIEQIKECFLDLEDAGFTIIVNSNNISILKNRSNFKYNDIKECLLFAIPYLQDVYGMRLLGGTFEISFLKNGLHYCGNVDKFNKEIKYLTTKNIDLCRINISFYIKGLIDSTKMNNN